MRKTDTIMLYNQLALDGSRWLMTNPDLNKLLENVATSQCQDSFQILFNEFSPKIFSFALSKNLNEFQAKEIVQNVMLVVWTKAHSFDREKGAASTWIFTIARNKCFDLLRKNVTDQKYFSSQDFWPDIKASDEDLEKEWQEVQTADSLQSAVDRLPDAQREAIQSVFFEEMTHQEYSLKSQLPLGTVKSQIRLALKKLKRWTHELN